MKNLNVYITSLLLVLLLFPSLNYGQVKSFTVDGLFKNWPKERQIVITFKNNNEVRQDSIIAKNGRFSYKGFTTSGSILRISYEPSEGSSIKDNCSFFVYQGKIQLRHQDSLKLALVNGPTVTMDYEKLKKEIDPLREQMVSLRIKARKVSMQSDSKAEIMKLDSVYKITTEKIIDALTTFIQENPKSLIALHAIEQLDGSSYSNPAIFRLFQGLESSIKQSITGSSVAEKYRVGMKTAMGVRLEEFSSLDTNRKKLSLSDVKAKGKITLIDFWASWCLPCREENPHMIKVYNEFHTKGFEIMAVSLDKDEKSWKRAIKQDQLPWHHVSALQYWDEPIVKQFGITGVPDSFLLDAEGRIIGRGLRGDKLYEAVKKALNE